MTLFLQGYTKRESIPDICFLNTLIVSDMPSLCSPILFCHQKINDNALQESYREDLFSATKLVHAKSEAGMS